MLLLPSIGASLIDIVVVENEATQVVPVIQRSHDGFETICGTTRTSIINN